MYGDLKSSGKKPMHTPNLSYEILEINREQSYKLMLFGTNSSLPFIQFIVHVQTSKVKKWASTKKMLQKHKSDI